MTRTMIYMLLASVAIFAPACGNSTDDAIDDYEELADDMIEALNAGKDPNDMQDLKDRAEKLKKDLEGKEDELTDEQKERVKKISTRLVKAVMSKTTQDMGGLGEAMRKNMLEGMNK